MAVGIDVLMATTAALMEAGTGTFLLKASGFEPDEIKQINKKSNERKFLATGIL